MREDRLQASVQYGDYTGTASADHGEQSDLRQLAQKHGIDTDRYFVMGVHLNVGENTRGELGSTHVSILAVDTHVVKAASLDYIQAYAKQNKKLPYLSFDIDATLEEVILSFKRFEIVLNYEFPGVEEFERSFD
jgi:hypothetical protein